MKTPSDTQQVSPSLPFFTGRLQRFQNAVSCLKLLQLWLLLCGTVAIAQDLPPEFKHVADQYQAENEAVLHAKTAALDAAKKPYLAALNAVEQKVLQTGKSDALKAIQHEKQLLAGDVDFSGAA